MKRFKLVILAPVVMAISIVTTVGQGLTLNFANQSGDDIQFNGTNDSFSFNTATNGYQWQITTESGGTGSAEGLFGSITNGPFSYGPIHTEFGGAVETATVTGPLGQLIINDGTGDLLGQINFVNITTLFQSAGVFNDNLVINVSNITYTGSNADLSELLQNQPGTLSLSFQFSPGMDLNALSAGSGPYTTSYSGSISVVPEPTTMALSVIGGVAMLVLRRRR